MGSKTEEPGSGGWVLKKWNEARFTEFTRLTSLLFWASSFVAKSNHWSSENTGRYSRILCMHRAYFEIKPIGNVDIEIFETLAENSALILRLGEFSALKNGKNLGK